MQKHSRRGMVRILAGVAGYILGEQASTYAQAPQRPPKAPLLLVLDGMGADAIVVMYRGQRVAITPQEIIDALK